MTNGTVSKCSVNGTIGATASDGSENIAYAGGIVGMMTGGNIENCTVSGTTINAYQMYWRGTSNAFSGGIVGRTTIANFETVKGCTFSGNVTSSQYAGGIAAYVSGGSIQNNHVTAVTNATSSISGSYASGGISGLICESTVLENCDISSSTTVLGGSEAMGGIVGIMNISTLRNNHSYERGHEPADSD